MDAAGNAYVTGSTASTEATFPVTVGPDLTYNGGSTDAFVAKVKADGTGLVYAGYIGGSAGRFRHSASPWTRRAPPTSPATRPPTKTTFPVVGGPDLTYNGGGCDAFVAKVERTGRPSSTPATSGASASENGGGIAVDGAGNAYVTGDTSSTEAQVFPISVGPGPDPQRRHGQLRGADQRPKSSIARSGSAGPYATGTTA